MSKTDWRIVQTKYAGEAVRIIKNNYSCIKICQTTCFSLGFHLDLKQMYIDFHIWNYFIHIGTMKPSNIPDELFAKVKKIQDEKRKEVDELLKDYHPLKI